MAIGDRSSRMPISDIPIFSMLKARMQWHQERQHVLSENVSNSDMPNYRPRDLTELKFETSIPPALPPLTLARTDSGHIEGAVSASQFPENQRVGYDIRPAGNAVNLEDEMMKVASNQMDYQAATALYTRSLGLIKIALGTSSS
jgi:flagellar basal-body rod protein FlgB